MATSKDFEKLWKQYQDEVQSSGKSIVTYCQENGIVYSQFERWYKKRGSSQDKQPVLIPVEVTDLPQDAAAPRQDSSKTSQPRSHVDPFIHHPVQKWP